MNRQNEGVMVSLSAFTALMTRTSQKLFMLMLAHLFSSFLDDATQPITSNLLRSKSTGLNVYAHLNSTGLHVYTIDRRLSTIIFYSA